VKDAHNKGQLDACALIST